MLASKLAWRADFDAVECLQVNERVRLAGSFALSVKSIFESLFHILVKSYLSLNATPFGSQSVTQVRVASVGSSSSISTRRFRPGSFSFPRPLTRGGSRLQVLGWMAEATGRVTMVTLGVHRLRQPGLQDPEHPQALRQ